MKEGSSFPPLGHWRQWLVVYDDDEGGAVDLEAFGDLGGGDDGGEETRRLLEKCARMKVVVREGEGRAVYGVGSRGERKESGEEGGENKAMIVAEEEENSQQEYACIDGDDDNEVREEDEELVAAEQVEEAEDSVTSLRSPSL
jgi:hypothetical protein